MADKVILRVAKLKAGGNIGASLEHNFRERPTKNAIDDRRHLNEQRIGPESKDEVVAEMNKLLDQLPKKPRKDAVRLLEYMISASPEWMVDASPEKQAEYFDTALDWLKEKHGAENIVCATIHRDESSPHLAVFVVPMTKDGRLCAKDFTGGRVKMSQMQSDLAKRSKHLGLTRGIKGSTATHQKVKRFYGQLESLQPSPIPELSPTDTHLTPRQFAKQLKADVKPYKYGNWLDNLLGRELETPQEMMERLCNKYDLTGPAKQLAEQLAAAQGELKQLREDRSRIVKDARAEAQDQLKAADSKVVWAESCQKVAEHERDVLRKTFDQKVSESVQKAVSEAVTAERIQSDAKLKASAQELLKARESHQAELKRLNNQFRNYVKVPDGVAPEEATEALQELADRKKAEIEAERQAQLAYKQYSSGNWATQKPEPEPSKPAQVDLNLEFDQRALERLAANIEPQRRKRKAYGIEALEKLDAAIKQLHPEGKVANPFDKAKHPAQWSCLNKVLNIREPQVKKLTGQRSL